MNKAIKQYLERHGFGRFSPKAVLFDMDGVIYDSMPNHARSWHLSMASVGIDMPEEEAYLYEGMRGVETIKLKARQQWHRELTDDEAQQLYQLKCQYFSQCPPAQKMPGTEALMQQIKSLGLTICVVTGSGQRALLDKLTTDYKGFIGSELIITSFDVKHGKPAPDPYLAGRQKAGVQPWETIIVENAPLGVQSAVSAGCFTIAVNTGPLHEKELLGKGADIVMPDMPTFAREWQKIYSEISSPR